MLRNLIAMMVSVLVTLGCSSSEIKLLDESKFEKKIGKDMTELLTLHNSNGCVAQFCTYGGRWLSMWVPDKNGKMTDVVLGFDSLDGYLNAGEKYHGAITGRVCGRINQGETVIAGKQVHLAHNDMMGKPLKNHLHGGTAGFHKKVWDYSLGKDQNNNEYVEFYYVSKDGEEGYPGNLDIIVRYTLTCENSMRIEYSATTDQETIVNMTNHAFFNLSGNPVISTNEHILQINADNYIECDSELVPTGNIISVKNTPINYLEPMSIGKNLNVDFSEIIKGKGYAIAYALNNLNPEKIDFAAKLTCPENGISMEVYTNMPSLQYYNGWLMDGKDVGKNDIPYYCGAGLVLESQGYPDAPNHSNFPSIVLKPGEKYCHFAEYIFKNN